MNKTTLYLLFIWMANSACEGRYPLKIDFEIAKASIIGREVCSTDTSLNAWLIDLGPTLSGKTTGTYYGSGATVNGKYYTHVVKTYSSSVSSLDLSKHYVFDFYVEDVLPKPSCNLPVTTQIDVSQIRVKAVSFTE